jgi:hypothetical protein
MKQSFPISAKIGSEIQSGGNVGNSGRGAVGRMTYILSADGRLPDHRLQGDLPCAM